MRTIIADQTLRAEMPDADEPKPDNPIHSTAGAQSYGFRAALVGGATVYGWAVRTIVNTLGEGWLADGWANVRFRKPVFPNDELQVRIDDSHAIEIRTAQAVCIEGELGLGRAPWLSTLAYPERFVVADRAAQVPRLTPTNVPVGSDLAPRQVQFDASDAVTFARQQARETLPQFYGDAPLVHPSWLAAQPIHLLHHSFDYGPAIHVESHIQHLRVARAGAFVVAGRCVSTHERNGHHYLVNDCVIRDAQARDVAQIRHTVIYQVAKQRAEHQQ